MANVPFRDISPVMKALRDFLLGRKHNLALRFGPLLAARTQPQPILPDGPAHKHADNYYYARDARREVIPPIDVGSNLLTASSDKGAPKQASQTRPVPGKVFNWDEHSY